MKNSPAALNKLIGVVGACVVRAWLSTVCFRVRCARPELDPSDAAQRGRYIYAFWHETSLAVVGTRKIDRMSVLISRHRDGEYIAQMVERLGACVVRGSSRRGGTSALLGLLDAASANHLLITPDGPRGPRRRFERGAVYLAARAGLPIVPVGVGFSNAWRASSWDRFAVPKPYSLVTCVVGDPIAVPTDPDRAALEHWRSVAERRLLDCTDLAEAWATRRAA